MLEIGTVIDGKYKILNEIGHGGMSIVYLAIVERANQTWAIKEVRKNGATKDDIVEQGLVAEMNILKGLNHPHLPRIVDIIDYEDSFLIVMDYIEGIDLDKKLKEGPQKWEDVVEWGKQLCDILAYLHSRPQKIIYRDMKPGNVKLKPNGDVVLFDFGTARTYKSQRAGDDTTCLGTRGYAAPEQYGGMGQTDTWSDIYCLGATMFHLVTGRLPGGPPDYDIPPIRSICPWLPRTGKAGECVRGLEYIIQKCTQPNPANRYQTCAEMMYDLENIDKLSFEYVRSLKSRLRSWIACIVAALVLGGASAGLAVASTKTAQNNYSALVANSGSYLTKGLSEDSSSYPEIRERLIDAIATDPTRTEAWIQLVKLITADYLITDTEYNYIAGKLKDENAGVKLKSKDDTYAKFCYEWGTGLFFFYGNSGSAAFNRGDPEKAEQFLKFVVGAPVTEDEEIALKDRLVIPYSEAQSSNAYYYNVAEVDYEAASSEYVLASSLYKISKQKSLLGQQSGLYGEEYTYNDYWSDLKNLMKNAKDLDNHGTGVNKYLIQCSLYSSVISMLNEHISDFFDSTSRAEDIANLIKEIRTETKTLEERMGDSYRDELRQLLDSIYSQCDDAEMKWKSLA